jgi:hypothetical protein
LFTGIQRNRSGDYPSLDDVIQSAYAADIMFAGLRERRFWILTHPRARCDGDPGPRRGHRDGRKPGDESVDLNFTSSSSRKPS